jgi:hypothetical protein
LVLPRFLVVSDGNFLLHAKHSSIQRKYTDILTAATQRSLFENVVSDSDNARLLACFEPESALWLQALLSAQIGTILDRERETNFIGKYFRRG